jgi:hypothetical protein
VLFAALQAGSCSAAPGAEAADRQCCRCCRWRGARARHRHWHWAAVYDGRQVSQACELWIGRNVVRQQSDNHQPMHIIVKCSCTWCCANTDGSVCERRWQPSLHGAWAVRSSHHDKGGPRAPHYVTACYCHFPADHSIMTVI